MSADAQEVITKAPPITRSNFNVASPSTRNDGELNNMCCDMCCLQFVFRGCRHDENEKPCMMCWHFCRWPCRETSLPVRITVKVEEEWEVAEFVEPLICDESTTPPKVEDVLAWGTSFDELMKSTAGRAIFRDYLRGEYSDENIIFWLACEELKKETNPRTIMKKARDIFERHISTSSLREVSLDSAVRDIVRNNMLEPNAHCFDEAQLQIYTLMQRDSYPRFLNSKLYKTLVSLSDGPK